MCTYSSIGILLNSSPVLTQFNAKTLYCTSIIIPIFQMIKLGSGEVDLPNVPREELLFKATQPVVLNYYAVLIYEIPQC